MLHNFRTNWSEQWNASWKLITLRKGSIKGLYILEDLLPLIFLYSDICNRKPYALPVQCVPYAGLKEVIARLCEAMNSYGMKGEGTTVGILLCIKKLSV